MAKIRAIVIFDEEKDKMMLKWLNNYKETSYSKSLAEAIRKICDKAYEENGSYVYLEEILENSPYFKKQFKHR